VTISSQKRQKQLAKKKAKRKLIVSKKPLNKISDAPQSLNVGDIPIYESRISKTISKFGMGTVLLSRKIAPGYVIASFFTIDTFCLGIKGVHFGNLSSEHYRRIIEEISQRETFVNASPQCVMKLVEGAANYAEDLGFRPPPDYQEAKKIFANIETDTCTQDFVFGLEGKPCYIASPFDKSTQVKRIIEKLRKRCGPDGFKVFIPVDPKQNTEQETPVQELQVEEPQPIPATPSPE